MEVLNQYLIDHIVWLSWLDYVDTVILIAFAGYGLYRIDSKINPLVRQIDELTQTNRQQQDLIDSQTDELFDLRQQVQELGYQHREVTELFSERNRYRDN